MSTPPRVIALLGVPIQNEDGKASEVVKPGHLVKGVLTIAKQSTAGGPASRTFALERDELGKGIDDSYTDTAGSANYAIGDYVKVGSFAPGMRVNALIASGQNIAEDSFLEPAGDGTLRAFSAGTRIGRAMSAVNNTAGPGDARISVELY